MVREELLHFIWKQRLYANRPLQTQCGLELEVIKTGEPNPHAGPDFFNARIKMGHMVWVGNVEIHLSGSDWYRHGHHKDPAYDNVILHAVHTFDQGIRNSRERPIPTLVLDYPDSLESRIAELQNNKDWLPCGSLIIALPEGQVERLFEKLESERMIQKTNQISDLLLHHGNNRDEALYMAFASGFGLPINCLPFEMLAKSVPFSLLLEHRADLSTLEAILFGQSGMLHSIIHPGHYIRSLLEKHEMLKREFSDESLAPHLWKFLRLRPASFPTLRLSQFASLVHLYFPMTDILSSLNSLTEIEQLLRLKASEYWTTHYTFGKSSPPAIKMMGSQSAQCLIINTIIPFLSATVQLNKRDKETFCAREILFGLQPESNSIIKNWSLLGIKPNNAFESQALIHLYKNYCIQKRCLECRVSAGFFGRP